MNSGEVTLNSRIVNSLIVNIKMLEIKDLHASVNGKEILKGINLSVKAGEVHAIMGPNGSERVLFRLYW